MTPFMNLHPQWQTVENAGGPWTLMRKDRKNQNALQISSMQRNSGERLVPEPNPETMAAAWATKMGGIVSESSAGESAFGRFGAAVFTARQLPYCQCRILTNGVHFIQATYICNAIPEAEELRDIAAMAQSLKLIDEPR